LLFDTLRQLALALVNFNPAGRVNCLLGTVTLQVAVLLPTLAVMVAVPAPLAVIVPFADTVATFRFDVVHVTVLLSVVLVGLYVTVSLSVLLCCKVKVLLFTLMDCKGRVGDSTSL
jgi:hypothetical protein